MKLDSLFSALVPAASVVVGTGIMAEARAVAAKANKEKVLGVAVEQLGILETGLISQQNTVRDYRVTFKRELKKLEKLDRAVKYANETGNFIPALYLHGGLNSVNRMADKLGAERVSEKDKVLEVPKDWKPAAPTPA